MSNEQIDELLELCASLPYGPQLSALLDQALDLAEESGDTFSEYRVRLLQADVCARSGDSSGLLGNFRWCLDHYDLDPQAYPADPGDGADLLWQYKWMNAVLSSDPQIPAGEIHAQLDEMLIHYRRAGFGLSAVATARLEAALANGWLDEAAEAFAQVRALDEDDYSHCDACSRSLSMSYYFAMGRNEEALACLDELLEGDFSCGEEPERAIAAALVELLRAGRGRQTKALHLRSYQAGRNDPDNLGLVAHHMLYLVVTGNLMRALALAERHLPWLAHDPMAQRQHLHFLCALGLLSQKLAEAGLDSLPVRGSEDPALAEFLGSHREPVEAVNLAPVAWAAARELAARFDERNANDWMLGQVEACLRLGEHHWDLPWEEDASLPRRSVVPEPRSAAQWLRRAREYAACGHTARVLPDIAAGLRERPQPDVAAGLHQLAMITHLAGGDTAQAGEHLENYLASLRASGHHQLAEMLGRYGLQVHSDGSDAQLEALEQAQAAGSEDTLTRTYAGTWLAHAQMRRDDFDRAQRSAAAAFEDGLRLVAEEPADDVRDSLLHNLYSIRIILHSAEGTVQDLEPMVRAWRKYTPTDNSLAQVENFLGQLAAGAGEHQSALEYANRALDVFISYEDRPRAILAADFGAAMLLEVGHVDQAKERLRLGLHQASLAEDPQRFALLFRLAQLHVHSGEAHEAIDYLRQGLDEGQQLLEASELGEMHDLLGEALALAELHEEAIESWQRALEIFTSERNSLRQLQIGEELVASCLVTGEFDAAQKAAEAMVELAGAVQSQQGVVPLLNALVLLASVQEATGEEDPGATLARAEQLAAEHHEEQLQAQILVRHAQWAGASADYSLAVSLMLQASSHFEQLEQDSNAAQGIGAAASYLAQDDRHQEAVLLFEQSLEHRITDTVAEQILRQRLADSLDALGQNARASRERRIAEQLET